MFGGLTGCACSVRAVAGLRVAIPPGFDAWGRCTRLADDGNYLGHGDSVGLRASVEVDVTALDPVPEGVFVDLRDASGGRDCFEVVRDDVRRVWWWC
jgi:hypothetical protein